MRNPKFRAYDTKEKKWLLGYELPNLGGFSMIGETMMMGEYANLLSSYFPDRLDDIALMQFTGLHDKNGKEIYEGDIIHSEEWNPSTYQVGFNRGGFCFYEKESDDHYLDIKYNKSFEVIGNIYENPSLLSV